jgi:hypothetical protein
MRHIWTIGALVVLGCSDTRPPQASTGARQNPCTSSKAPGEALDLDVARCLADNPAAKVPPAREHPVVLYLDHSASIQGFLDPEYPTRIPTDFRSVIDKLVVGVKPARAYGYGVALREVKADLGVIGQKSFYSDRDTRMEDALRLIARDTLLSNSHVVVGDARRGSPDAANSQFSLMREVAGTWIDHGGTFAVASSLAPFKTVESDPSGCRRGSDASATATGQTCPLYAFAFIPPGDELRILTALSSVFVNLFAWPVPTIPGAAIGIQSQGSGPALTVEPSWERASDGSPVARTRGPAATNTRVTAALRILDSVSGADASAKQREWLPVDGQTFLIRPSGEPRAVSIVTRGRNAQKSIVRLDVMPSGDPSWLNAFDAANATDVVRTYGFGRLFEPFRQRAANATTPFAHAYFVVN